MPQIHYGNDILRETTSSDQTAGSPPIGSLRFYNRGDASQFGWANGNPLQIAPAGGLTMFHCTDSSNEPNEFQQDPNDNTQMTCVENIWIISAIG
jgi:hypothetical protein